MIANNRLTCLIQKRERAIEIETDREIERERERDDNDDTYIQVLMSYYIR